MQKRSGKKTNGGKHITVKVYEEIKDREQFIHSGGDVNNVRWVDNNGINTPYLITYV